MSATTAEMPTVVVTPETVVIPTREENLRYMNRVWEKTREVVVESKNMFMRALRWMGRKAKEAWNWFSGRVKVGWEWVTKKASNGWERTKRVSARTWDWFKARAKEGWAWGKKASRWTWDHGVAAVAWAGKSTRVVLGSVLGVTWLSIFGVSILAMLAIGLTAGLLLKAPLPPSELTPVEQKIVNKLMSGPTLVLSEAQEKAISYRLAEFSADHINRDRSMGTNQYESGFFVGQVEMYTKRLNGSTAKWELLYEDWELVARRNDAHETSFPAVKAGMRAANREINKLLALHSGQVTEPVVV